MRSPVHAFGRSEFATVFQGFLVFWIVAEAARRWRSVPQPESDHLDETGSLPGSRGMTAGQILGLWLAVTGVGLAAYGIYQVLGPAGWPKTFATLHDQIQLGTEMQPVADPIVQSVLYALQEGRAFSTFGAANIFGGFLAIALLLLAGFFLSSKRTSVRVLSVAGAVLVAWALVLSQSRGAMLALAVSIPFFAWRVWRHHRLIGRRLPGAAVAGMLILLSVCLIVADAPGAAPAVPAADVTVSSHTSAVIHPPPQERTFIEHLLSIQTVRQRVYYWQTALALWARDPFTGGGLGSYKVFYPQLRLLGSQETIYAHSWFFQFGSETGVMGLALFMAILIAVIVAAENAIRSPDRELAFVCTARPAALLIAFEAALLALLLHGLVEYTLSQRELYLDLQAVLGILAGVWACHGTSQPAGDTAHGGFLPGTQWTFGANHPGMVWTLRIALVAGAVVVYIPTVVNPLVGQFYSDAAKDVSSEGGASETFLHLSQKAVGWEPDNPWYLTTLGQAELESGNPRGLNHLAHAARLNPYSASIQSILARAYLSIGSSDRALAALRRAVELHPLDPDHHLELAEYLLRSGNREEARREMETAATLPLLSPTQLERIRALRLLLGAARESKP